MRDEIRRQYRKNTQNARFSSIYQSGTAKLAKAKGRRKCSLLKYYNLCKKACNFAESMI